MEEILIKAFEKAVMNCDKYYQLYSSDSGVYSINIKNSQDKNHDIHIYLFIDYNKNGSHFGYDNIKYNIDYDISSHLRKLLLDKQKELKDKQMQIDYDFLVNYITNS